MAPLFPLDSCALCDIIQWWLVRPYNPREYGLDPVATTISDGQERSGESQ